MQYSIRHQSARAATLFCNASAAGRRRPSRDSGTARPCATLHDAALHARQCGAVARGLPEGAPPGEGSVMTHVAFLRAINVGGRAVVKMIDLKAAFERAGCRNVRTFIASGNVLFDAPASLPAALKTRIAAELLKLFGNAPGVCYRTLAEIDALIAAEPFAKHADKQLK